MFKKLLFAVLFSAGSLNAAQGIKDLTLTGTTADGSTHNASGAHTFLSGASATFASGSTLTLSGALTGTPTGGTLSLANLTLTLPATVSGGLSSFQPLDSDLTSIAALATTSFGRGLLTESSATTARSTLSVSSTAEIAAAYQPLDAALTALAAGSDFVQFTGPTTSTKTFTLPNASATILTNNAAVTVSQGGTGVTAIALGDILYGSGTNTLAALAGNELSTMKVLTSTGIGTPVAPVWTSTNGSSGNIVRNVSPSLVTPTLGVASATSLDLTGTSGAGFITLIPQASAPSAPASGLREFADSSGRRAWIRASDGFTRTWDATLTANRVYGLPDASGTVLLNTNPANTTTTNLDSITATSGTNLTLTGGSTGASLTLGQGSAGIATFNIPATGYLKFNTEATTALQLIGTSTRNSFVSGNTALSGAKELYLQGSTLICAVSGLGEAARFAATTGNLLIGGTTDISGSGGLKVFGTTDATNTTSGALQCAGGGSFVKSLYVGGGINAAMGTTPGTTGLTILGGGASNYGFLSYTSAGATTLSIDNAFDNVSTAITMRVRTLGTPITTFQTQHLFTFVNNSLKVAPINYTQNAWSEAGATFNIGGATITDGSTAASGTVASATFNSFQASYLAATNSNVTTTDAANVFIANAPLTGSNQTITNAWGLWNKAATRLDGTVVANAASNALRITNSQTPASAGAAGTAGTIAWDANYLYVCTATNTWKRAALSTW